MFKLQTKLSLFRFGSRIQTEPVIVTWYKLDDNRGRCFSKQELEWFSNYVQSRPDNFETLLPFDCYQDSFNYNSDRILLDSSIRIPKFLMLNRNPKIYEGENIFECMDIILLNNGRKDDHDYYLTFSAYGHVEI